VLYKLCDRKESSRLIGEQSELYDIKRHQYINRFDQLLNQVIRAFKPATKVVLEMLGRQKPTFMPEADIKAIECFPVSRDDREEFFSFYSTIAIVFTMISKSHFLLIFGLLVNGGLRSSDNKRLKFEEQAAPE
jgi:hypothetical protein